MTPSSVNAAPPAGAPAKPVGFWQFYEYYLSCHQNRYCRRLHLLGLVVMLSVFAALVLSPYWWLCWLAPLAAYPFAWTGHFVFERNVPATFKNPLYSALADLVMARDVIRGRIPL